MNNLLTKKEVADTLKCSVVTVYRLTKSGVLPRPFYIHKKAVWSEPEVLAVRDKMLAPSSENNLPHESY